LTSKIVDPHNSELCLAAPDLEFEKLTRPPQAANLAQPCTEPAYIHHSCCLLEAIAASVHAGNPHRQSLR
jgi:hypothetical protein